MSKKKSGMYKNLTNYGDSEFSIFLRKAWFDALQRRKVRTIFLSRGTSRAKGCSEPELAREQSWGSFEGRDW